MKRKIALLVLCVAGMLLVLGGLAFSFYAPHITAAASSTTLLVSPAPVDTSMVSNTITDDAEEPVLAPVQRSGHYCNGDSAKSAEVGY